MKVIFDLDGTLALTEHRAHFLQRPSKEKDWRSFYAACDKDRPCVPLIAMLMALWSEGHEIEVWTGRSKEVADKTDTWFRQMALPSIPIKMREIGDHRADTVLKKEWLDQCEVKPNLVFEDRASMVAMWRAQGIVCCQVAPGDF